MTLWKVTIDDPDQAAVHDYVLEAPDRVRAALIGAHRDDVKGCGLRGERPSALRKAIDACDRGLVECSAMYGIVGPAEGEGPAWVPQSWDVLEGLGTGTFNPETVSR